MCDNLDDEKKEHLKRKNSKRKKEKRDNLHDNEKEKWRKYEKKVKKFMRDGLEDDEKFKKMIRKETWINVYKL